MSKVVTMTVEICADCPFENEYGECTELQGEPSTPHSDILKNCPLPDHAAATAQHESCEERCEHFRADRVAGMITCGHPNTVEWYKEAE